MTADEQARLTRKARIARGLCIECGRSLSEYDMGLNRRRCRKCREARRDDRKERRRAGTRQLEIYMTGEDPEAKDTEYQLPTLCSSCEWMRYAGEGVVFCPWPAGYCAKRRCTSCVNHYYKHCRLDLDDPDGSAKCKQNGLYSKWEGKRKNESDHNNRKSDAGSGIPDDERRDTGMLVQRGREPD